LLGSLRTDAIKVKHKPRLLSDNGPSYIVLGLAKCLDLKGVVHTRGRPYLLQTQGKIERWHRSLKNRILLEHYYFPEELESAIWGFVEHYNNARHHESLDNLTPADVHYARGESILARREQIKLNTMALHRRTYARNRVASLARMS
jgi:transposase InsO family protein|tara:strand:- start:2670 stop:3107 length:438 start_codon:yes stop_codon:yes gene_type:complete